MIVYIGTYTGTGSRGIYVGDLDAATGQLTLTGATANLENPSYLAVDPQRLRLYAVSEVGGSGGRQGVVSAFAIDPDSGGLTLLNDHSSGGAGPCHLSVDLNGHFVLAANYGGGSVALLPLHEDGRLAQTADVVPHEGAGVHPTRQASPHPHFFTMDPRGRYALATDLGTDSIEVYDVAAASDGPALRTQSRTAAPAGAGPRHLAFHPTGPYAYVINELDSTLTAWRYDADEGRLSEIQTLSTLPPGFTGPNSPADVHVHPSGLFLYGSNRGHDSLAVVGLDPETGRMTLRDTVPAGGQNPRGFAIDPTGNFLVAAHQDTGTVVTFAIHPVTGALTPTGSRVQVPSPVCVKMLHPVNGGGRETDKPYA